MASLGKSPTVNPARRKVYAGRILELNWAEPPTTYETRSSGPDARMSVASELLSPEDILLDLDVTSKKLVFEAVARLFERRHGLQRQQVEESLAARERLGSTGLGQGVAIPHARIKHLPRAMAAFVRMKMPIPFEAPDAKPVSEILVLLVPEKATERHLQILADFAQMFADRGLREQIRACESAQALHRLFCDWTVP